MFYKHLEACSVLTKNLALLPTKFFRRRQTAIQHLVDVDHFAEVSPFVQQQTLDERFGDRPRMKLMELHVASERFQKESGLLRTGDLRRVRVIMIFMIITAAFFRTLAAERMLVALERRTHRKAEQFQHCLILIVVR